jgi:hypothetical protein
MENNGRIPSRENVDVHFNYGHSINELLKKKTCLIMVNLI